MKHKELLAELIKRESGLITELKAIRTLIDFYSEDIPSVVNDRSVYKADISKVRNTSGTGVPKGDTSWSDYAFNILSKLGSAKASQIIKLAIIANPDIPEERIKNAITSKLSKLFNTNVIEADKSANLKEGYTYRIKKESNDSV